MTNSILIGEVIYDVLNTSTEVQNYVGTRYWPIVAPWTKPEDIKYPFVVYTRNSVNSTSLSKDGYYGDSVLFQIDIISSKYDESVYLANIVRGLFDNQHLISHDMDINSIKLVGIKESYSQDSFIQTLSFSCSIENV